MISSRPYPRRPLPLYTTLPGATALTTVLRCPAMSMPLPPAAPKRPSSVPSAGHIQPPLPPALALAAAGAGATGVAGAGGMDGGVAAGGVGLEATGAAGATAATVWEPDTFAQLASEYASNTACGSRSTTGSSSERALGRGSSSSGVISTAPGGGVNR